MRRKRVSVGSFAIVISMICSLLIHSGCSKEKPFQTRSEVGSDGFHSAYTAKSGGGAKYPQIGSVTLHPSSVAPIAAPDGFQEMFIDTLSQPQYSYGGGEIKLANGSRFVIESGSLLPPKKLNGKDVTIQLRCDHDKKNKELIFEFHPSGCSFSPAAEVWFKWSDLGSSNAVLYLISSHRMEHIPNKLRMILIIKGSG